MLVGLIVILYAYVFPGSDSERASVLVRRRSGTRFDSVFGALL